MLKPVRRASTVSDMKQPVRKRQVDNEKVDSEDGMAVSGGLSVGHAQAFV